MLRQSSLWGYMMPVFCGHAGPDLVALNVPSHAALGTGGFQRFSPPADSANGIPRYAFTAFPSDVLMRFPQSEPCFIVVSGVEHGGLSKYDVS
jgi:hypothetical protein